jgi:23S rRNA (adenine2503-C2)-methyltransferase
MSKGRTTQKCVIITKGHFAKELVRLFERKGYEVQAIDGQTSLREVTEAAGFRADAIFADRDSLVPESMDAIGTLRERNPRADIFVIAEDGKIPWLRAAARAGLIEFVTGPTPPLRYFWNIIQRRQKREVDHDFRKMPHDSLAIVARAFSPGAEKFVFVLADNQLIEAVALKLDYRTVRHVICVSVQVGCTIGCRFCATGRVPFGRNLTAEEIVGQVRKTLGRSIFGQEVLNDQRPFHITYMGEGEAMMNYGAVVEATKTLRTLFGERISFTISTVGLLPGLKKLVREDFGPWVTLQLSLHAPNDALRAKFVPVTGQLSETIRLAREYAEKTGRSPASPNKVCVNYVLVQGKNDTVAHAEELAKILDPRCFYVKLSRLNLLKGSDLKPSSRRARNRFEEVLKDRGYTVKHFLSRGTPIGSGCGQMIGDTV